MAKNLSTEPYKGTRDFYPEDMAIQSYIFDTWAKTAKLFGFEQYDASILEPSELYKSKGAENEEMVNEQTYTFVDRGNREVTLRPEMTPTVARMIAAKRRELSFPVRWYSIPNLFRYERPQRGRLREHRQFNCDLFGCDDVAADIEMIALAYHTLRAFGATDTDFTICINDRAFLDDICVREGLDAEQSHTLISLLDRKEKINDFDTQVHAIAGRALDLPDTYEHGSRLSHVFEGLASLGITNVSYSASTVRGFNYYTGVIFEVFDTSPKNNRALIGGGRYDNLTSLFGGDPISGIGFGMGDVSLRDFLETHKLLPTHVSITAPTLTILPTDPSLNLEGEKIATVFRAQGISVTVDLSAKKIGRKVSIASDTGSRYVLVVGANEVTSEEFTLKELTQKHTYTGTLTELINYIQ